MSAVQLSSKTPRAGSCTGPENTIVREETKHDGRVPSIFSGRDPLNIRKGDDRVDVSTAGKAENSIGFSRE